METMLIDWLHQLGTLEFWEALLEGFEGLGPLVPILLAMVESIFPPLPLIAIVALNIAAHGGFLGFVYTTDRLFRKLVEQFYREETGGQASTEAVGKSAKNNLFEPQPLHFQVKRDTPATKPQKERLYRLAEQHKITLEVDVEKLTRSEASRLADKILAKYGR